MLGLTELGRAGLVERCVDAGPPIAVSYGLAPAGQALLPVLRGLTAWAEDNLPTWPTAGAVRAAAARDPARAR